jgi:hypothetical protein
MCRAATCHTTGDVTRFEDRNCGTVSFQQVTGSDAGDAASNDCDVNVNSVLTELGKVSLNG